MKERETIRIAIVVASPDILGGQAVQAARLIEGLSCEPGIEAELLPINPRLPGWLRWLQSIKYVRTVVTTLLYIALLLVKLPRFDVVHIFSASYFSFLLAPTPALLIAKLYGKATLLNYHSGEAEDHLRRWPTAIKTLKLANRLIVPSPYLVEIFARFGLSAAAIANLVDLSQFRFRARTELAPVLLSNRNFEAHYNVDGVLRAFALVQRELPESRLIVAGYGSERARLEQLADELSLTGVEFVGKVEPQNMAALYDQADLFINASKIDNQPLSILEAFACGLPVVTTRAGGITCMVTDGETGLLTECGDEEALAAGVVRLLTDRGLATMLIRNARREVEKYDWQATRADWLAVYRELANRQPTNHRKPVAANESLR